VSVSLLPSVALGFVDAVAHSHLDRTDRGVGGRPAEVRDRFGAGCRAQYGFGGLPAALVEILVQNPRSSRFRVIGRVVDIRIFGYDRRRGGVVEVEASLGALDRTVDGSCGFA